MIGLGGLIHAFQAHDNALFGFAHIQQAGLDLVAHVQLELLFLVAGLGHQPAILLVGIIGRAPLKDIPGGRYAHLPDLGAGTVLARALQVKRVALPADVVISLDARIIFALDFLLALARNGHGLGRDIEIGALPVGRGKALLQTARKRHMGQLAAVAHPAGHRQAHQGIELGKGGVAGIFGLNEQIFGVAHVHLGLQHVQTRAQTHIIKGLRDALLIAQAGQGVLLAAHVFLGLQIGQKGLLHLAGHVEFGLTQGGTVALGLQGGLLVLGQQAETLKEGLGNVHAHAPGAKARRAGRTGGGGTFPLLLVGLIAQAQAGAELASGGFAPFFRRAAGGFRGAQAGIVRQRAQDGIGHGHGLPRGMPVGPGFRASLPAKDGRLQSLVHTVARRGGLRRGKIASQKE